MNFSKQRTEFVTRASTSLLMWATSNRSRGAHLRPLSFDGAMSDAYGRELMGGGGLARRTSPGRRLVVDKSN